MKRAVLIGVLAAALSGLVTAAPADPEIEYLLDFVAASGCTFIRNGSEHSSADAADHLRLKYRRGRRYADTAEAFIDNLASESSWTGRPYKVVCEGRAEPSADWLHRALKDYRATD